MTSQRVKDTYTAVIYVMGELTMSDASEYQKCEQLIDKLLAVPRRVIEERITKHRERAAQNPVRRGPKSKTT